MKSLHGSTWVSLAGLLALVGCASAANGAGRSSALQQAVTNQAGWSPALQQAAANYPPLIVSENIEVGNHSIPRSCPKPGGRVEQRGGPTMEYFGADPSDPDLCIMRVGGEASKAWYGIWANDWPGQAQGRAALRQIIHGNIGEVAGFDTDAGPGRQYHDLIRNEGVEQIELLDQSYQALKISHYREGFNGNGYRSVSTIWKDIPTGLLIYGTYQHIAGAPVVDDPLGPTEITPAP